MLTKKAQTKRGAKLRDDVPQLLKDSDYLKWLHTQNLECFSCGGHNGIELHHIKSASSDAKNDHEVIPLCGVECHRLGTALSAHSTPNEFRKVYPIYTQKRYAKMLYKQYEKEK